MYARFIKRGLDILISVIGLLLLALPMLAIMIAIKIDDPGPALFYQERYGLHKKHFIIYKFRTMRMDAPHDVPTRLLKTPEKWITRVGRVLRAFSLDELPQLVNILKGDMSLIGPRPVPIPELDLVLERDKYGANDVLPGLSGWAQINGRDEIPTPRKAELDGEYARSLSFAFDVKCLLGTFSRVARREGVVEGGVGALEDRKRHEDKGA